MSLPYLQEALLRLFKKPVTRDFPHTIPPAAPRYRGRIVYHADKCINCGLCIRVCAPQAITKTIEPVEGGDLVTMEFHMGSCTFCNTCADFCSRGAIELTEDYMIVVTDEDDLKVRGSFVKKKPAPKAPAAKAAAPAGKAAKDAENEAPPAGRCALPKDSCAPDAAGKTPPPVLKLNLAQGAAMEEPQCGDAG